VYYVLNICLLEATMSIEADKEILLKLGGSTKVAELLGFKDKQRVQNWMKRGIPAKIKLQYPHIFLNPNIQSHNAA
ncbi:hypothetical protein, partial [Acinetobacter baumannii]